MCYPGAARAFMQTNGDPTGSSTKCAQGIRDALDQSAFQLVRKSGFSDQYRDILGELAIASTHEQQKDDTGVA